MDHLDETSPSNKSLEETQASPQPPSQAELLGLTQPTPNSPSVRQNKEITQAHRVDRNTDLKKQNALTSIKGASSCLLWGLILLAFLMGLSTIGATSGYMGVKQGRFDKVVAETVTARSYLEEQYILGLEDMQAGRYQLALQRFEYIYQQDPSFNEAAERWVDVMLLLEGTATATPPLPTGTPTLTPTVDPRPIAELFAAAQTLINAQDWTPAIETLLTLRNNNPDYNFVEVDGMLYLALRNRGVIKIKQEGNLEGGLYDFSLAESFGPLDREANNYRDWARLYLMGNSFWYAYPELAAQYYGQVAGAVPYLTDSSGITAWSRYWQSLVHNAEQLADKDDWCAASEAYQDVLNAGNDVVIQSTAIYVQQECLALTPSTTPSPTGTMAPSVTPTIPLENSPTATLPAGNTPTPTSTFTTDPGLPPTNTLTPIPATATHTLTTLPPTATHTSTFTPTSTATPTPTPTNTTEAAPPPE
jgi:tetratricopeptide (TPR) repeat protein